MVKNVLAAGEWREGNRKRGKEKLEKDR